MGQQEEFWNSKHSKGDRYFLTDSPASAAINEVCLDEADLTGKVVLNIGVGTGRCTKDMSNYCKYIDVMDISTVGLEKVKQFSRSQFTPESFCITNCYDYVISHLVLQHMLPVQILEQFIKVFTSLKRGGVFAFQFLQWNKKDNDLCVTHVDMENALSLGYTIDYITNMIACSGGIVLKEFPKTYGSSKYDCVWNVIHATKG